MLFMQLNASLIPLKHSINAIEFWDCPSNNKWLHHHIVDKDMKKFNLSLLLPCKESWDFNKKEECNNIIKNWQMTFQASDLKSTHLLDDKLHTIEPLYIKGGPWIKQFSHSNSLCARATKAIMNYTPIDEYHLRFFLREDFSCLCGVYPIETRHHILYESQRYNKYWNLSRSMLSHLLAVFSFHEGIT